VLRLLSAVAVEEFYVASVFIIVQTRFAEAAQKKTTVLHNLCGSAAESAEGYAG